MGALMGTQPEGSGQELLSFAHGIALSDLPIDVIDRAKTCLLEAIGCGIFGSTQPWSRILLAEMAAEGAPGRSIVLGSTQALAAPAAALVNGTAIHGFELDDLIAESITHPAACVIPAALAAAEAVGASGARLIEAIVLGYEVMHRVGLALGTEPAKRGFHTTSLVAPVACAVAAGKVMQLSPDQLYSAVGLACSAASGIKSFAAGRGGGIREGLRALPLDAAESTARAHRVDQVKGDLDAGHGAPRGDRIPQVSREDLHPAAPRHIAQLPCGAHEDAHLMTGVQQLGDQPTADVTGGTGDEYSGHANSPSMAHRISSIVTAKPTA